MEVKVVDVYIPNLLLAMLTLVIIILINNIIRIILSKFNGNFNTFVSIFILVINTKIFKSR